MDDVFDVRVSASEGVSPKSRWNTSYMHICLHGILIVVSMTVLNILPLSYCSHQWLGSLLEVVGGLLG